MNGMRFGVKIENLRKTCGLTQRELADAVGIKQPTVSDWADKGADELRIRLPILAKLARTLGVSVDFLIDDAADEVPAPLLTPDEVIVLDVMRALRLPKDEAIRRLSGNNHGIVAVSHPPGPDRLPPPGRDATRGIDRVTEPASPSKRRAR